LTGPAATADRAAYDRAVECFGRQRIALPTFARLATPARFAAPGAVMIHFRGAWIDPMDEVRHCHVG